MYADYPRDQKTTGKYEQVHEADDPNEYDIKESTLTPLQDCLMDKCADDGPIPLCSFRDQHLIQETHKELQQQMREMERYYLQWRSWR